MSGHPGTRKSPGQMGTAGWNAPAGWAALGSVRGADEPDTAVLPETDEQSATERRTRKLPPYKVVLHNDDVNDFGHVIRTILKLTPLEEEEAVLKTLEAHETGHAVLLVTSKERAELYVEQFATFSLTVTCEPDA